MTLTPTDIEAALLGAVITDPRVLDDVALAPDDWSQPHHRALVTLLASMRAERQRIDVLTVTARIGGEPDRFGGFAYVLGLPERCPSVLAAPHYAKVIAEAGLRRRTARLLAALAEEVTEAHDLETWTGSALSRIARVLTRDGGREAVPLGAALDRLIDGYVDAANGELPAMVEPPWDELDEPLRAGQVLVIGARPGSGKTSAITGIAVAAARQGHPVLLVSLEMRAVDLAERMAAAEGVDYARLRDIGSGRGSGLRDGEWERVCAAKEAIETLDIVIDDRGGLTVEQIAAHARALARRPQGLRVLLVDYLQLVRGRSGASRYEVVTEVSAACKALALELGLIVVLASQLSRGVEGRKEARPMLSDLRESGQIEQDADVVWLMWRPCLTDDDAPSDVAYVSVAKNRAGLTGTAELKWEGRHIRLASRRGGI